jgi:ABC-2 type transport system ATP-binding protein
MDEAERCHRISYISYGHMLATGTVAEVVRASGLSTFVAHADASPELLAELRALEGVSQVAPFGATLHVVGAEGDRMAAALRAFAAKRGLSIEPAVTSLEDVFIHFMGGADGSPAGAKPA